jgi:hypothetical protein
MNISAELEKADYAKPMGEYVKPQTVHSQAGIYAEIGGNEMYDTIDATVIEPPKPADYQRLQRTTTAS